MDELSIVENDDGTVTVSLGAESKTKGPNDPEWPELQAALRQMMSERFPMLDPLKMYTGIPKENS